MKEEKKNPAINHPYLFKPAVGYNSSSHMCYDKPSIEQPGPNVNKRIDIHKKIKKNLSAV